MSLHNQTSTVAINDLPNEIILHIISEAITFTEVPHEYIPCTYHHYRTRAMIMGVCRKWHQLMEASPELWTSYTVGNPWSDPSEANVTMPSRDLIDVWQERSQNRPIDIHLYSGMFTAQSDDSIILMTALIPSINRWSRIDISFTNKTAEMFLLLDFQGHGLKEIRASSFCGAGMNDQLLSTIGQWPHLEILVWISAVEYPITAEPTFHKILHCFPWQRLRYISLEVTWTQREFRLFFSSSISAQTIQLNLHTTGTTGDQSHPLITLPLLRYLGIESDSRLYRYIGCLHLTGIRSLALFPKALPLEDSFGWGIPPAINPNPSFLDFLNRTTQSAQAMIIYGLRLSNSSAQQFFSHQCTLRIPVLEIEIGEMAAAAVIEYINFNASFTAYNEGGIISWCCNDMICHALRDIFPSFSLNYHSSIHVVDLDDEQ